MGWNFGKGYIEIDADTSPFSKGLKSIGSMMAKTFAAGGVAVAGLAALSAHIAKAGDEFDKMSEKIGMSVESLSKWRHVADLGGTSFASMSTGLRQLAKNSWDASMGTGEAKDAFERLDLKVTDSTGALKSMDSLMLEVSDKFKALRNDTEKAAIAQRIFGRSGLDMIPALHKGSAAIKEQMAELERLGGVWTGDATKASAHFNDNLGRMARIVDGLKISFARGLLPSINNLVDGFIKWYEVNGAILRQDIESFFRKTGEAIEVLGSTAEALAPVLRDTFEIGGKVALKFGSVVSAIGTGMAQIIETGSELYSQPWMKVVSPVVGLNSLIYGDEQSNAAFKDLAVRARKIKEELAGLSVEYWKIADGDLPKFNLEAGKSGDTLDKDLTPAIGALAAALPELRDRLAELRAGEMASPFSKGGFYDLSRLELFVPAIDNTVFALDRFYQAMGRLKDQYLPQASIPQTEAGGYDANTIGTSQGWGQISALMGWFDETKIYEGAAKQLAALEDYQNNLAARIQSINDTVFEASLSFSNAIGGFFSDSITSGFASGGKKFLAALAGIAGRIMMQTGAQVLASGLANIVMGLWNPFMGPNPAQMAAGKKQVTVGGMLMGGMLLGLGGALSGISSGIGGTSGAGSSFQSSISRPYSDTIQPITYDTSGADKIGTTITINAVDAASFVDLAKRNPEAITGVVLSAVEANGSARGRFADALRR